MTEPTDDVTLADVRRAAGTTQAAVASAMGVSAQRIGTIERTPTLNLTGAVLARYLQAIRVTMELHVIDGAAYGKFRTLTGRELRFGVPGERPGPSRSRSHLTSINGGKA
jgi:transcriptional regulator with XRE-family HTH domain